jgi:leucyl-tRNA synthetase
MSYDFRSIEAHWQETWDRLETFKAVIDRQRPKYYVLDMFPYPSGDGLHVGHPEGYTATDIMARYKRARGFNVLHPMGWDAFGLPAERYAMRTGTHPAKRTAECIANFKRQLKTLGFSYDWSREIDTTSPDYYRWTQWIFLKIWGAWYDAAAKRARPISELPIPAEVRTAGETAVAKYRDAHRLAYLTNAPVNWCPELRVVLANEEVAEHVEAGREVVRLPMTQWMMRITCYTERLLEGLEDLDWPKSVVEMQRNWIGRSEGAKIDFAIKGHEGAAISVFTTRPDTLFGATYMVLAPEHPLVAQITSAECAARVEAYVDRTRRRSERDRQADAAAGVKTGEFCGAFCINPVNGQEVPIWIADYVLMGYGTGAIMAVPGHDERDHAFAKAMNLPIVQVVAGGTVSVEEAAHVGDGVAVNSGFLDGLASAAAKSAMIAWLEERGIGSRQITYKLRDWLFSRQRYWGEPFPLLREEAHVDELSGHVHAVAEADLPVLLPDLEDFNPSETGEPPLAKAQEWRREVQGYLRETNTMPQWAGSCWYYLRFCDATNNHAPWAKDAQDYWMPVDLYVGGAEHAVLHLLYSRFWHKVLFDLGEVSTPEPFKKLVNQGMVLGATYFPKERRRGEDGKPVSFLPDEVEPEAPGSDRMVHKLSREPVVVQWDKMSKSKGNVVNPDDVIRVYGADTMRLYEMFMGPLEASAPWQPDGVVGCHKFLQRVHRLYFGDEDRGQRDANSFPPGEGTPRQRKLLHQTIADVTERIERMAFNTAIAAMMVFVRDIEKNDEGICREAAAQFAQLLAPFAPHLAEECWRALGHEKTLAYDPWPAADPSILVAEAWTLVVMINGKKRGELSVAVPAENCDQAKIEELVRADENFGRLIEGKTPKKCVYVPGKLLNWVV